MSTKGIVHPFDEKVRSFSESEVRVMSERSVSENNKLWEAAERIAEKAVAAKKIENEQERRKQKKRVVKLVLLMMLIALIIVFASIAWFAMNKAVTADTMAIEAKGETYTIEPYGDKDGLYDSFITGSGVDSVIWTLSTDDNMKNLYSGDDEPDMQEITRLDSEQYGLKPGDHGTLKFKIVSHSSENISVSLNLACTGYKAQFDADNYKTAAPLTEVDNVSVNNYLTSHIVFFYKDSSDKLHMLTEEGFTESVTADQEKAVTLYWFWPATLKEILDAHITDLSDNDAANEVKRYFFEHPEKFLKPVGNETFDSFSVNKQDYSSDEEEDAAIAQNIALVSGKNYNTYGSMYNDADQAIGDHVNYLLVELSAD